MLSLCRKSPWLFLRNLLEGALFVVVETWVHEKPFSSVVRKKNCMQNSKTFPVVTD
jgi:hypothetical protein